jgi:hypothetical protein
VKKALQLKGVKSVEMDFENGLFTLAVDSKTGLKPSEIKAAVPSRFSVASIEAADLVGDVGHDEETFTFTSEAGLEFLLQADEKNEAPFEEIHEQLHKGKSRFKIAGTMIEAEGKTKLMLKSAAALESGK